LQRLGLRGRRRQNDSSHKRRSAKHGWHGYPHVIFGAPFRRR
jgi:hypothetical protein